MKQIICPKCKTDNPEEANFCRHCGHQFKEFSIGVLEKRISDLKKQNAKIKDERDKYLQWWYKENKSKRFFVFLAVALFLILSVGIFGIFYVSNNNKVEPDELVPCLTAEELSEISKGVAAIPDDFVLIEGGRLMHYLEGYENYDGNKPIYKDIDLDSYYICKHEVTQKEYEDIMSNNPSTIIGNDLPVNTIGVLQACLYCNERSKREGYSGFYIINGTDIDIDHNGSGYRLPTEYEWVLASRPDFSTKTKYAGGDNIKEIAWYGGNSNNTLHEVCTKTPNKRGIYDLNGNVSEWLWVKNFYDCNAWIGSYYTSYISFGEDNIVGNSQVQVYNGFRVVLIQDSCTNTTSLSKIKAVIKPFSENGEEYI